MLKKNVKGNAKTRFCGREELWPICTFKQCQYLSYSRIWASEGKTTSLHQSLNLKCAIAPLFMFVE